MSKSKLTVLANKIGIDAKAIINKAIIDDLLLTARSLTAHRDEDMPEQWKYSHRYPAFKGSYEFDFSMELFGERVARRVKAKYENTPEWEYFDLRKKEPYVGWEITHKMFFEKQSRHKRQGGYCGSAFEDLVSDPSPSHGSAR